MVAEWKKITGRILIHIQRAVFVVKRSMSSMIFYREVTVIGWDPEGATKSPRNVSAALGYTIPETGKMVILIVNQIIFSPSLNHNLLSTMKIRLHDVVVNETPKLQCLEPI
jgi:hypothetical protein